MGTLQVPGRLSGRTYTVNIKGDTPSATEQERIRQLVDERETKFTQRYTEKLGKPLAEPDDGTALGRGFERGKAGAYSRLGTATEYLGSGLGLESLVGVGQGMRQAGDYEGFLETLRQPAPTERKDVTGIGSALTYAGEGIGQSIPEMLAPLAAGAAGTIAGTAATGNPLTGGAIGLAASGVTAFPSFFGGNIQRQEAEVDAGRKAEVDVQAALKSALGQSALNAVGDKLLLGGFLKPGQKWLTRTLIGGAEGAATEVPTEIAQQMLERQQAGLALDSDDAISEYIDAGILGGIMGGGVRATTAGLGVGMEKKPDEQRPEDIPPSTTGPVKPGAATVLSTMVIARGSDKGTVVRMSDNSTIRLPGTASKADIAKAVAEYNQTKAQAEAPKAPAVVPPTVEEEAPRVPSPFTVKSGPVPVPITERAAAVPPPVPTRWSSPESDDFDMAARFAEEDRIAAETGPVQKDLFVAPTVTLPTAAPVVAPAPTAAPLQVLGVDEAIAKGVAPIKVVENGKEVPFKNFALSVDEDTAEVGFVERGIGARRGIGYDAYVALGESLAERGVTLQSTKTLLAPGRKLWEKLQKQGKATFDPATNRFKFGAPVEAPVEAPVDTTVSTEGADVTTPTEAQPEAMGISPDGGTQGVGDSGRTEDIIETTPGAEAPAGGGLGRDLPVPMDTAIPEGQQPATLTPARQLIPGTTTPVSRATLQPIGKPRMERSEVYAPTEQAPTKVSRDIQEQAALADLVRAYVARTTLEYRNQTGTGGGINSKTKFAEVPEWTTLEDKLVVLGLLESTPTSPQEKAAKLYFSKTVRPSDALDMMIDDLTAAYQLYNNTIRSAEERRTDPDFELKKDTGSGPAALALEWIRDGNLDPATVDRLNFKIALDAEATRNLTKWSEADRVVEGRAASVIAKENTLIDSYLSGYFTPGSPDALRAAELIEQRAEAADLADTKAKRAAKAASTRAKNAKAKAKKMAAADRDLTSTVKALIRSDPLMALDQRLHYGVLAALERGDLRGALRALAATTNNPMVATLATRFAALVPNTKVMLVASGDPLLEDGGIGNTLGAYYPRNYSDPAMKDTIVLNRNGGSSVQALLHEVAHAATRHVLAFMPNHPFVRQMTDLFEYTRNEFQRGLGKVEGASTNPEDYHYGLTDVSEFVAELLGRVNFGRDVNGMRGLLESLPYPTVLVGAKDKRRNAWDKFRENFANFIRSLFGRSPVQLPQENALDLATRLADGLLALSPNVVASTALADASVSPLKARNVLNNAILNAPVWDSAGREKLSNAMQASVPMPLRRTLLGLLHLDWFADLAGKYFPEIRELKVIDDLRRGDLVRMTDKAKPVLQDLRDYAEKNPEMYTTLASLQGRATIEEVDPTRPVSVYGADQDKVRIWHELNRELNAADSTGEMRKLFKTVRNMMTSYRDEIKAILAERVKDLSDDVAMQNQLVSRLMAKLDEGKAIDPYFSLMRKGDFWISYTAEDTTAEPILVDPAMGTTKRPITQYVQAFESVWEREQFKTKLAAAKDADGNDAAWNVEEFMRPVTYIGGQTVPSAFVQGAINIVAGMVPPGATAAQQDKANEAISAIQDMFVRFTPENSLMKSFTQRKGTRGFIGDITPLGVIDDPLNMVHALAEKSSSLAYQLANMKYGAKIQKLRNRAQATEKVLNASTALTAGEKAAVQAYREEFDDRAKFAQSPNVSKAAQIARGVTFGMTLGFNVAGAANNLMQIPMIGTTELGGRYGMRASLREIGSAARLLMNAGKTYKAMSYGPDGPVSRELSGVDNFGSVANYFEVDAAGKYTLRTDKNIPAKLRAKLANLDVLVEVLSTNGMLANSMAQEMLETDAGWGQKINKWSGFLMHHGERFNRQTMAIAAYNLELGKIEGPISDKAKLAAAMKAVDITERVNGSIGAATAPRFAQGSVGSVVFMFKRFGLHMARYIINTANQALRGASKEDRAVARYQIIGMLGTTALFAGVQGLPFFGELMSLINLIFTDDEDESAEVQLQKYLQEPFYHGALNYLTGAEVASRISMSGLIFRENKMEKDQSLLYDLVETLGGPAVGVFMNAERGVGLLSQGETYRGIEAMMPSAIKSVMKSARFGTEGATTIRRDEIVPLSNMDVAMQFLGYTPGVYARTQQQVSGQKRIDEAVRVEKRNLYRKYYLAYLEGDFEELRSVVEDMREFSRNNPEEQITGETLSRSLNSNLQRSKEMIGGVSFSPNYRPRAVQELSEFDEDTSLWGG